MRLDFMKTYDICIDTCMGIKKGEKVLIITNDKTKEIAEGLASMAYIKEADPYILFHTSKDIFKVEPPELIVSCMQKADVTLVALPFFEGANFFHTQARKDIIKRGGRFAMVWITPDIAKITKEEIYKTRELSLKIAELLTNAKEARVITDVGTDITMNIEGRKSIMLSSILDQPGNSGTVPEFAEAAIAPIEETAEGIVYVDSNMAGFEDPIVNPIIWKVKGGRVIEIKGGEEAERLKDLLQDKDHNAYNIAELGVGVVDKFRKFGDPDDKKLLGAGHIAIGDNRFGDGLVTSQVHLDGVFKNMTLQLDGKIIMERGVLKI